MEFYVGIFLLAYGVGVIMAIFAQDLERRSDPDKNALDPRSE